MISVLLLSFEKRRSKLKNAIVELESHEKVKAKLKKIDYIRRSNFGILLFLKVFFCFLRTVVQVLDLLKG
jgi:hypothetical protein